MDDEKVMLLLKQLSEQELLELKEKFTTILNAEKSASEYN
tara:strand:+ start:435 stop:554 length:120 start_codon:yes stop_codon:yes gene_type:complete